MGEVTFNLTEIVESSNFSIVSNPKAEGKVWDIVAIETGLSKNGNLYPADVLKRAVPLFEGAKVFALNYGESIVKFDHLPGEVNGGDPSKFLGNLVGFLKEVRFGSFTKSDGKKGEGIMAKLNVLEGHKWLRENLRDIWNNNKSSMLGFSINGEGKTRMSSMNGRRVVAVDELTAIRSLDIVTDPAAGGEFTRLVASMKKEKNMQEILDLIKAHRPAWLEGFAKVSESEVEEQAKRVIESNLKRAKERLANIPKDEVKSLAEVARGVNVLQSVSELLNEGVVNESLSLLEEWISKTEISKEGTYAYPYVEIKEQTSDVEPEKQKEESEGESKEEPKEDSNETKTEEVSKEEATEDKEKEEMSESVEKIDASAELQKQKNELDLKAASLMIKEAVLDSGLPEKGKDRVIKLLASKGASVTSEDITSAIADERDYISSFTESGKVTGMGDAHSDVTPDIKVGDGEKEKWGKAWDGLFNGGRMIESVEPFHSLHDAWGNITGKYADKFQMADNIFESIKLAFPRNGNRGYEKHLHRLSEGWNTVSKSDGLREAITTSDFSVSFGDSMFRRLQKVYREDPRNDWRKIISSVENLTDATNSFKIQRVGGVGTLPIVNQNAPYQEFTDPTEVSESLTPNKHGALLKLTWEDVLADNLSVVRRIPDILGGSAVRTIHEAVWDEIDTNPSIQGNALISTANINNVSSDPTLAYAAVTDAVTLMRNQTEQNSGKKLGLSPKYLLVGPDKENEAIEITMSTVKVNAAEDATAASFINHLGIQAFPTLGLGRQASPATTFRWYVAADPNDADTIAVGFLGGRDRPEIFVQSPIDTPTAGASFDSDALTFKTRLVFGVKVLDWRWIVGSLATS